MDLKNKTAIITGSSRGIGKAIAIKLSELGCNVIINYNRNKEQAEELVESIKNKFNVKAIALKADISNYEEVRTMINLAIERFEKIDFLVNNAGISRDGLIQNMEIEDWEKVIKTNLNSVFYCSKIITNHMIKNLSGKLVNISSISGETGNIGQTSYSASKAGIIGFSKALAKELARHNINVNVVSPGLIKTEMTNHIPEQIKEKILKMIPFRRIGTPKEIANVVAFLLSKESDYITGQIIRVNGGLYI